MNITNNAVRPTLKSTKNRNKSSYTMTLVIRSSNLMSLNLFLKEIANLKFVPTGFGVKTKALKRKKMLFSLLKSPHVNKTAQENFQEVKNFRLIKICNVTDYRLILFLKQLIESHPGVDVKVVFSLTTALKKTFLNKTRSLFDPDAPAEKKVESCVSRYLKLLDIYGEMSK